MENKAKINQDLFNYLRKQFQAEFNILSYENAGKDHNFTLDFGDDEIIEITIRERKGDNGNYRVTKMA